MAKKFKCPCCEDVFISEGYLERHVASKHKEMMAGMTPAHFIFNTRNGKNSQYGSCIICKGKTTFNEVSKKYNRLCGRKECHDKYIKMFRERMVKKYGTSHLLNDPSKQKEMLAHRSISGKYKYDDKVFTFTGDYELDFLIFMNQILHFPAEDLILPAPITLKYRYNNIEHFYIPDAYIPSLHLIIEIKASDNKHYRERDLSQEEAKDKAVMETGFNFIKIFDKDYAGFLDMLQNGTFLKPKKTSYDTINEEYSESSLDLGDSLLEDIETFYTGFNGTIPSERLTEDVLFEPGREIYDTTTANNENDAKKHSSVVMSNIIKNLPSKGESGIDPSIMLGFMPFNLTDISRCIYSPEIMTIRFGQELDTFKIGQLVLPPWGMWYITESFDGKMASPLYVAELKKCMRQQEHPLYDDLTQREKQFLAGLKEGFTVLVLKQTRFDQEEEKYVLPKSMDDPALKASSKENEISKFRHKNRVELIVPEDDFDTFLVTQRNWFLMGDEDKGTSNAFSTKKFGSNNVYRIAEILRKYENDITVPKDAEEILSMNDIPTRFKLRNDMNKWLK